MAKIRIGETTLEAAVRHSGNTLSLTFEKAKIEEIAALLSEANAPQIREIGANGLTCAIYLNHALTRVFAETAGGVKRVTAVMQTETIEQTEAEALRAQIEVLAQENEMLTQCLLEMSEYVYA